ncbi:hypothetical protein KR018_003406, partial [Drosophila ironensis]
MREVNFVNRCTRLLLFLILKICQICGVTTFNYCFGKNRFTKSKIQQIYCFIVRGLIALLLILYLFTPFFHVLINPKVINNWKIFLWWCFWLMLWRKIFLNSKQLLRQFNKLMHLTGQLSLMARNPNIFRLRHLMLLIFAVQNVIRSMGFVTSAILPFQPSHIRLLLVDGFALFFLMNITLNICLNIVLIAVFNNLHRSARRISNSVKDLRNSQVMEPGQIQVLAAQLETSAQRVAHHRSKAFKISSRIVRIFQFHWLLSGIFGVVPFFFTSLIDRGCYYFLALYSGYTIFNMTICTVLSWQARTTRSFCHFHLTNYHKGFDAQVDELLHQEICQPVKMSFYGIELNLKFALKLLSIGVLAVIVRQQSYLLY